MVIANVLHQRPILAHGLVLPQYTRRPGTNQRTTLSLPDAKLVGPEHLLYGSDYPHNIGDMKGCANRVEALSVGEEEKELIRSGNAVKLFGL